MIQTAVFLEAPRGIDSALSSELRNLSHLALYALFYYVFRVAYFVKYVPD